MHQKLREKQESRSISTLRQENMLINFGCKKVQILAFDCQICPNRSWRTKRYAGVKKSERLLVTNLWRNITPIPDSIWLKNHEMRKLKLSAFSQWQAQSSVFRIWLQYSNCSEWKEAFWRLTVNRLYLYNLYLPHTFDGVPVEVLLYCYYLLHCTSSAQLKLWIY